MIMLMVIKSNDNYARSLWWQVLQKSGKSFITDYHNRHYLLQLYGVDWDGPLSPEENCVEVPNTRCPITHNDSLLLKDEISPLDDSTIHGIDLYERTLQFVTSRISS